MNLTQDREFRDEVVFAEKDDFYAQCKFVNCTVNAISGATFHMCVFLNSDVLVDGNIYMKRDS